MILASDASIRDAMGKGWAAAELPYTNGRFAALLVEPTAGTMPAFLHSLTPAGLSAIVGALRPDFVNFSMPVLKLAVKGSLDEVLSAMGLAPAYQQADFTPMLGPDGALNQAIGTVRQAATLNVDRWGTDAAAATGVSVVGTAATTKSLAFDHPYLFLIRDTVTGTVLFSSVIENPAGT
jgi:serpin B